MKFFNKSLLLITLAICSRSFCQSQKETAQLIQWDQPVTAECCAGNPEEMIQNLFAKLIQQGMDKQKTIMAFMKTVQSLPEDQKRAVYQRLADTLS